ncbi:MAG: NADH-quinone oxidoreductase subunit [Solirubrobacteraceae bacterium]|jgi:NADH-quinone oxidoreductase subunit M|nr:NADH-quinone oxidoreductase subunit [Solirubrobacteraceae bacterium]
MDLSLLLWLPAASVLVGALLPGRTARAAAVTGSLVTLGLSIALLADFKTGHKGLQFLTNKTWISELGIHYKLGVDGLNIFFILLATLLFAATFVWSALQEWERERTFYLWLGIAETAVLGALLAQDLALFVAFFDLMLIPFYFLAGQWGGPGRVPAVTKLVIYTLVGSLLMLAAAVATAVLTANALNAHITFELTNAAHTGLADNVLGKGSQEWIFLCFAAAFLVKMPLFPLHGWMPDGYRAMPMPVLAVFSGVLSKVAAYGFLRIVLPLFPAATVHFQDLMLLIALASILYGSAMAFTTTNARLVLGYSSVAQLGFIVLGIFALRNEGAQGAILQSVNHGLVVAPAFFIVALLAARAGGSEDLRDMGGLAFRAPVLATLFLIVALATLAMPGSSNFVGEFLILLGVFRAKLVISIVAFTGVALASVYTLRLFIRAMHNRPGPAIESREMSFSDGLVLAPLVAVILFLAVYPQFILKRTESSAAALHGTEITVIR